VKNDLYKILVDLKSFDNFKISNAIKNFNDAKNVCRAFLCWGARQSPLETGPDSPARFEPSMAI
jgi:hypothetical protein